MSRVSVVIVEYKARAELRACLKTIPRHQETIVIDNNQDNIGFSRANNQGAAKAKGQYIFFLNPDTLLQPTTIQLLTKFLDAHPKAGVVAPLLLDPSGKPYPLQGTSELTPLSGIFSLSFINKIFPNNAISKKYWLHDWSKKLPQMVSVVPGTALMVRKSVFDSIGGFDPNFFLFFEESDLCKRIHQAGFEIWMYPKSKVTHLWARSTPKTKETEEIFKDSRFYYFRKHYGLPSALLVELFCRFSKKWAILMALLVFGFFFRILFQNNYNFNFPDITWYQTSAKSALSTGAIPLVGIPSSITWLHQGALWTYVLMISEVLHIPNIVLTQVISLFTIIIAYASTNLFAAAIVSLLPFAIQTTLTPYHTSLLPILFFGCVFFIRTKRAFMTGLSVGLLYQTHLLTFIYWPLFIYMCIKSRLTSKKVVIGFVVGILPFILSGPVQTVGIFAWLAKQFLLGGQEYSKGVSTAYFQVLLPLVIFALSSMLQYIGDNWHRTDKKRKQDNLKLS